MPMCEQQNIPTYANHTYTNTLERNGWVVLGLCDFACGIADPDLDFQSEPPHAPGTDLSALRGGCDLEVCADTFVG